MQEYLFDKEALRKLIAESGPDQNRIAITINLERPQDGIQARAIRFEPGSTLQNISVKEAFTAKVAPAPSTQLGGCPNPPGC
ncbi:hypothetical protein AAE02nite_08010 [Adhaeribacter aerolatus]|uniref:Uncharacterized protein n=1 Tax=Adhaeribacter aerolatus TaxID=670289 RepID=A0A512AU80_9BACT|nr:hypothetical protein [Adhaeribacter aerolatus]GEO03137.1 hypothetical protein AAE02nite_08010 [Adhaeribacter aerolatus]